MATVAEQLRLKLALERRFKPEIQRVFSVILRDFKVVVAARGMAPQVQKYGALWSSALNTHYNRVQKEFLKENSLATKQREDEPEDAEVLALALLTWRENQVQKQVPLLNTTTQVNMTEAMQMATEDAAMDGTVLSKRELALLAGALLNKKFKGRISSIAITETQGPAESTKFIGAEVDAGLTPRILGGGVVATSFKKGWVTVGDNKVREIHRRANGQERTLTEPFVVNNQYLMYPGDSSLGASADNVANCRCIAKYF